MYKSVSIVGAGIAGLSANCYAQMNGFRSRIFCYTANWRVALVGWAMTTKKMGRMMGKPMRKTLPDLEAFRMIGQWVEPGSNVELSAASGRDVIKDICEGESRPFFPEEE